ncbi:Uu.00g092750.m01.CDS01 [Anthostomella pinea]|uniref:Uu.00g092750.m01.CDS01 n=1 Tax=Anthostomella pinea TaxID=933095 RepID=A0AAI8VND0_9PEZI|nr:Uu.00g092750.m01.CDS01 [Anthostomella pinea]
MAGRQTPFDPFAQKIPGSVGGLAARSSNACTRPWLALPPLLAKAECRPLPARFLKSDGPAMEAAYY